MSLEPVSHDDWGPSRPYRVLFAPDAQDPRAWAAALQRLGRELHGQRDVTVGILADPAFAIDPSNLRRILSAFDLDVRVLAPRRSDDDWVALLRSSTLCYSTSPSSPLALLARELGIPVATPSPDGPAQAAAPAAAPERAAKGASVPVFVVCRDRLADLKALLAYLDRLPRARVILVDNASTYEPFLEFLRTEKREVIRLPNLGSQAVWRAGLLERLGVDGRYVVTDPDVVPVEECPADVLEYFEELLDHYPERVKVGLGLRIDDLPACYPHRARAMQWEAQFWARPVHPRLFDAAVDTTFAMYQRWVREPRLDPALRTGAPYLARHMPWYLDFTRLSEEERYYRDHALSDVTNWNNEVLGGIVAQTLGPSDARSAPPAAQTSPELR